MALWAQAVLLQNCYENFYLLFTVSKARIELANLNERKNIKLDLQTEGHKDKYWQIGVLSQAPDKTQVLKACNLMQIWDETQKQCLEVE